MDDVMLAAIATAEVHELDRGSVIDRYVILGPLGTGGMGVVYKAYDPELDRPIALKLVTRARLSGEGGQADQRLLREAKALAKFSHPNVVVVHDVGAFEGDVFIAMEFVSGPTLRTWLRDQRRDPRQVLDVFLAAGAGLAAAHRAGIVHRDFKPDNVIVGDNGRVRVLDFGLARPLGRDAASSTADTDSNVDVIASSQDLTRPGTIMGTPSYMAPEQDAGTDVGPSSDQFSFCVALYEALYRQPPFEGATYAELKRNRAAGKLRAPAKEPRVPARVRSAVLAGLRADPRARHPTMEALLDALRARPWVTRARLVTAVLALAVFVLLGWTLMRSTNDAVSPCVRVADSITRTWGPFERTSLFAAFAATKHPRASAIAADVARRIDEWVAEWTHQRVDVCEAQASGPAERREVAADMQQCLERQLTELDARIYVYSHVPDLMIVDTAVEQLDWTTRPSACNAMARPALPPEMKEQTVPIMREVIRGRSAQAHGELDRAETILRGAVDQARGMKSPAVAIALLMLGQAQAALGKQDAARATLRESIQSATSIKDDGIVADAWIEIMALSFRDRRLDAELEQVIFAAELAVQRAPRDAARHGRLSYTIGTIRAMQDDLEPAVEHLTTAIADFTSASVAKHRLDIGGAENTLGMAYTDRGDFDLAQVHYDRALEAWKQLGPETSATATILGNIAYLKQLEKDLSGSESFYQRAFAMLDKSDPIVVETAFGLGYLYVEWNRCDEAREYLDLAYQRIAAVDSKSSLLALPLMAQGRCALARGDIASAVATLDRAYQMTLAIPLPPRRQAQVELALARALWRSGHSRDRAISLANQARNRFARLGGARDELRDADAFLASTR